MRAITIEAVANFYNRREWKKANTAVKNEDGFTYLLLHGHRIARIDASGSLCVRSAGWETNTTKERLNGLSGVNIHQKDWIWYLNGEQWADSQHWTEVN